MCRLTICSASPFSDAITEEEIYPTLPDGLNGALDGNRVKHINGWLTLIYLFFHIERLPRKPLEALISAPRKCFAFPRSRAPQKQPLTSKLAVAVYYALSRAYLIAYAQITQ